MKRIPYPKYLLGAALGLIFLAVGMTGCESPDPARQPPPPGQEHPAPAPAPQQQQQPRM